MSEICKKHKDNPVEIYSPCVGCEIDRLIEENEQFDDLLKNDVTEIAALRRIISECAAAVGAGVAPVCSIEFMSEVPKEVALVVADLRRQLAEAQERMEDLENSLVEAGECQ